MTAPHEPLLDQIKQLLAQQEYEEAGRLTREILYEDPDCPDALYLEAMILTETGHQAEALAAMRYYFSLGGSNPDAWEVYGCAHLRLKNWEQAEAAFRTALDLAPDMGSTWRNLAVLLSQTGQSQQCYEALQRAYSLDPEDILTMYALSSVHLQFGALDKAKALLIRLSQDEMPPDIRAYARDALATLRQVA